VDWEDFYWAWQNNGDGHVGGHGWWMVVKTPRGSAAQTTDELPTSANLFIPTDPFALHVDAHMCIKS
jgi:hypothetical protein